MGRLDKKVAVITGGAKGMGAATVRLFVQEGAKVVIADLDAEGAALAAELGSNAFYCRLDITDQASWQNLVAETTKRFGGIDVLVNNAAIFKAATILNCELADFENMLRVNVIGGFLGMKTVAPLMIERKKGSIVNVASTSAFWGFSNMVAYGTSKWGMRGLSKMAAMELGPLGIRVNCLFPGCINTTMSNPSNLPVSELNKINATMQPMHRVGETSEIAYASLYLASDESSYTCGAELTVDGGQVVGIYTEMPK